MKTKTNKRQHSSRCGFRFEQFFCFVLEFFNGIFYCFLFMFCSRQWTTMETNKILEKILAVCNIMWLIQNSSSSQIPLHIHHHHCEKEQFWHGIKMKKWMEGSASLLKQNLSITGKNWIRKTKGSCLVMLTKPKQNIKKTKEKLDPEWIMLQNFFFVFSTMTILKMHKKVCPRFVCNDIHCLPDSFSFFLFPNDN